MFRKITSLMLLAAAAFCAAAQDTDMGLASNERVIGYTVTNDIDVKEGAFGTAGTYPLGAYMMAGNLKPYAGCRIVGLRVAAGMDLGRSRTFLYSVDGDQMTLVHEQRQRLYEGWNRIDFNGDGFTIELGKDLFFGFDYTETPEMVAADKGGLAAVGEDASGATMLFQDNQLQVMTGIGMLCVQLIIDVTNMNPYAIYYDTFDTGFKYKQANEEIEIFTIIRNVGRDAISTLRMAWQFDDHAPQYVDLAANIPSGGTYTWNQTLAKPEGLGIGAHTLCVFPSQANGTEIAANEDNTRSDDIAIYTESLPHNAVLVETFTNSSAPASILMNDVVNKCGDLGGKAILVQHHSPGTPLATPESAALFERYAFSSPVFTLDRSYYPGEPTIAYNPDEFMIGLMGVDFAVGLLDGMVAQNLAYPNFATLSATGKCNADNSMLSLEVNVDALPEASAIYGTMALHVMLVEDNVKSSQSLTGIGGRPITNNNYIHNNVVRLNHTGVKGQPVTLENNTAKVNFEIPLDKSWKPADMRAVVYITKYFDEEIPANLRDADITNAIALPLAGIASVDEIATDGAIDGPSTYYTIGGTQVSGDNLAPGLYIERRADGSARKILVK